MKIHANARTCPHCRSLIVSQVLDEKRSPTQVAAAFWVSTATVHKWLRRFQQKGPAGLIDESSAAHTRPRRQLQPGMELHDAVMKVLHTPPSDYGYNRTSWRMGDIRTVLDGQGNVATLNNIRTTIRSAGVRWRQARVALTSRDPDYRVKLDAIKMKLANLQKCEVFFSIDELGLVAVKMRAGRALQLPGQIRTVPQWQTSRGAFIVTAALELASNQITWFFSERKNSEEVIRLIDQLREGYHSYAKLYLSWDAAPWHSSARLNEHLKILNESAGREWAPRVEVLELPTSAQFLNVIESVFSGLARAVLHNSDYASLEDAKVAVARYLDDRNETYKKSPKPAGHKIWRMERVPSAFSEVNNCKDPRWLR